MVIKQKSPINGRWTLLSIVIAVSLGLASLLIFLTPAQLFDSFDRISAADLGFSLLFFLLGCWLTVERWNACLGYRLTHVQSFHIMGVAHAANLLIPGRAGEPLRVFLVARLGLASGLGASAVVQERLGDQVLRVIFLGGTIFLAGMSSGQGLGTRLLGVSLATVTVFLLLASLINHREKVAEKVGAWLGKIPRVEATRVSSFFYSLLTDLAQSWTRPGGKKALFWGLLAWLVFTVHTQVVLDSFFTHGTLAMTFLLMSLSPATAPTHAGFFHGVALGAWMLLGADKVSALQAAVVLHAFQMVVFTLWGGVSWVCLDRHVPTAPLSAPPDEARDRSR